MNAYSQKFITQFLKMWRSRSILRIASSVMVGLTVVTCKEQPTSVIKPVLSSNDFQYFMFREAFSDITMPFAPATVSSISSDTPNSPPTPIPTSVSSPSALSITWNDILRAVDLSFPSSDRPTVVQALSYIVNPLNATPAYAQAAVLVLGYRDKEAISQLIDSASGDARDVLIYLDQPERYHSGLTIQEIVRRYRELQLPVPGHLEEKINNPQPPSTSDPTALPIASQARYQEAIRNCTVGTLHIPEPTGLIPDGMVYMVIMGSEQNHCRVEYFIAAAPPSNSPQKYLVCQYSQSTINLLVSSPNDTEALNRAIARECQSLPQ